MCRREPVEVCRPRTRAVEAACTVHSGACRKASLGSTASIADVYVLQARYKRRPKAGRANLGADAPAPASPPLPPPSRQAQQMPASRAVIQRRQAAPPAVAGQARGLAAPASHRARRSRAAAAVNQQGGTQTAGRSQPAESATGAKDSRPITRRPLAARVCHEMCSFARAAQAAPDVLLNAVHCCSP